MNYGFEYSDNNLKFYIREQLSPEDKDITMLEIEAITKDYNSIYSPYPNDKEFIFADLKELLNFRKKVIDK